MRRCTMDEHDWDAEYEAMFGEVTPADQRARKYGRETVGVILVVAGAVYSVLIFGALLIALTVWAWGQWT